MFCRVCWKVALMTPFLVTGLAALGLSQPPDVTQNATQTLVVGNDPALTDDAGRLSGMLVFFTHQKQLQDLLPSLQTRFPADTPVAIVCDVSYPTERVIRGTLGDISQAVGVGKLPQLCLFYVGDRLKQTRCCP